MMFKLQGKIHSLSYFAQVRSVSGAGDACLREARRPDLNSCGEVE
jgi:hypothetical protein